MSLSTHSIDNPLLTPFSMPWLITPFDEDRDEHFESAFQEAICQHRAEIELSAGNSNVFSDK